MNRIMQYAQGNTIIQSAPKNCIERWGPMVLQTIQILIAGKQAWRLPVQHHDHIYHYDPAHVPPPPHVVNEPIVQAPAAEGNPQVQ